MALWLALVLPDWPLQLARQGRPDEDDRPLVVSAGPAQRPWVVCADQAAQALGIHAGQKLAAAKALASQLEVSPRDPAREAAALEQLAAWAYQYSGQIVPRSEHENGLLIEIGASLRLFDACGQALARRIHGELAGLGITAHSALATTPQAAWWLACARAAGLEAADALTATDLAAALDPLPLSVLGWDDQHIEILATLGVRRIAEVLRLPRAAFIRRFGSDSLAELARARGEAPDPQPPYLAPKHFAAALELPADLVDATLLLAPARRLLGLAEGWLRGRAALARRFHFAVRHSQRRGFEHPPTAIDLALARPQRDGARLAALLSERLGRTELPAPAIALSLSVEDCVAAGSETLALLPAAPELPGDWTALAETLVARLGPDRVFGIEICDEHRPEFASRSRDCFSSPLSAASVPSAPRPLWLYHTPIALGRSSAAEQPPAHGGALRLLAGPERIESGWWDGAPVARDYFVARNPRGQTFWIYRELAVPQRWFIHGLFA